MDTDESLYHAAPQTHGRIAHQSVDNKTSRQRSSKDLISLPVYSTKFNLMGKIDLYRSDEKLLIERKYQLKQIFQGQIYQLWAQYFCLLEMGYEVQRIAFYETSTNKIIPVNLPTLEDTHHFTQFIERFRSFDPSAPLSINPNKCKHCIYCNLCDKTSEENVYQ